MDKSKAIAAIASTGLLASLLGLTPTGFADQRSKVFPEPTAQPPAKSDSGRADQNQAPLTKPTQLTIGASPADSCRQNASKDNDNNGANGLSIGRGDKLKLSFYEVLESTDQKWGAEHKHYQEPSRIFQLHNELSSDYVVQDDGSISIPLLGRFAVEGQHTLDSQRWLECAFVAFLGRVGFVNIASVIKPPIYVVGKVKSAGSYDFTPGMTVLQAIALAGGFEKTPIDPSQVAELTRETQRLQTALERAVRMMARSSAIEAVRSSGVNAAPPELAELAGKEKASTIMSDEFEVRKADMQALVADEQSLKGVLDAASTELNHRKARLPLTQQAIDLRRDRVDNLSKLAAIGNIGRPVLLQAQTELLDAQERGQESQTLLNQAQEQVARAARDLRVRKEQAAINVERDLAQARQGAMEQAQESSSAADLIKVISRVQMGVSGTLETEFKIIRRTHNGVVEIPATGTTLLEPGDLVKTQNASEQTPKK